MNLDHVRAQYRKKVASDLLAHQDAQGLWDTARFDPLNDYQRHLYALHLRLADVTFNAIWGQLYTLSTDVSEHQRQSYVDDVMHSEIVGFSQDALPLLPILGIAGDLEAIGKEHGGSP